MILKLARRALDTILECTIFADWRWDEEFYKWVLGIEISTTGASEVPALTRWYVFSPDTYPWGEISVMPSAEGGLTETFPHQLQNRLLADSWFRTGKLCLSEPISGLTRIVLGDEPFSSGHRLEWHVKRLVEWLKAADSGSLLRIGDHFELPDFSANTNYLFAFNETDSTFQRWQSSTSSYGMASIVSLSPSNFIVRRFSVSRAIRARYRMGKLLDRSYQRTEGSLGSSPRLCPW